MVGPDELPAPVVKIQKSAVWRRMVPERGCRNIRAFEVPGPPQRQVEDFRVRGLQARRQMVGNVVFWGMMRKSTSL
jgi:hypothetical protein